jgi:hypothetical protein
MIAAGQNVKRLLRFRKPKPKDDRDGGSPAPARQGTPTPDPPTSHDPGVAFLNRLTPSAKVVVLLGVGEESGSPRTLTSCAKLLFAPE